LQYLEELWPDDPESIEALQLWFGYCLTPDTRQHKLLALIGAKRSGKTTIGRVMRAMVGKDSAAAPTLSSLASQFGLWPLVGKTLAVIGDARLSGRQDAAIIVERLLSITGEDAITIDRKCLPLITMTFPTRLVILSNEIPRLADASGTLASRMIVLRLARSWYGKEDKTLVDALMSELPGILWWAIQGWQRLQELGALLQPESAAGLMAQMQESASPVGTFVRDECRRDPEETVSRADLYAAYREWCEEHGHKRVLDEAGFGRDLRAAVPELGDSQHRVLGKPVRYYAGLALLKAGY
jgi:putative DNA primase/helicase